MRHFGLVPAVMFVVHVSVGSGLAQSAGTPVEGTVSVSAEATDDVGVVAVHFLVDGIPLGPADDSAPWSATWNTTTVANGSHTVTAIARDAAGNVGRSAPLVVDVANSDTVPPTVVIILPQ